MKAAQGEEGIVGVFDILHGIESVAGIASGWAATGGDEGLAGGDEFRRKRGFGRGQAGEGEEGGSGGEKVGDGGVGEGEEAAGIVESIEEPGGGGRGEG